MWPLWRSAYRSLVNRPGFFLASVLTLTLCIGANSAMFSLIDAVLLRPLPYAQPGRLVLVAEANATRKINLSGLAPVQVEEWNRLSHSFVGIGAMETQNLTDTSGQLPEKLVCADVSRRFFSLLGVLPLIGRQFIPEEETYGGPNAALISESLWRRRFGADPNVFRKALRLNGMLEPIVGVMPASFRMPYTNEEIDVWLPSAYSPALMQDREARFYVPIGRLRDDATVASAQADLNAVQAGLAKQFPATDAHWTTPVQLLKDVTVGGSQRGLWILFGAVGLVLLIGCANVACLLLTQGQKRRREIAIRFSLGARRGQIVRQLLCEAFLVALPGAIFGLLLSGWATDALRVLAADQIPRAEEIRLSWPVVWFTLSLSVLTTFLFGLIPAWTATGKDTAPTLSRGSRNQAGSGQALLRLVVAGQVALAVVLLVGAGLFIRTLSNLSTVPLGFNTNNLLTLHISASWAEQKDYKGVQRRMERTLNALENIPGVTSAAIALNLPGGSGADYNLELRIAGRDSSGPGAKLLANAPVVSASYFHTLGIPLLSGEMCRNQIDTQEPQETMVNRTFAERFFPNENPVGHILLAAGDGAKGKFSRISGVVGDARDSNRTEPPAPTAYWCTLPGFFPDPIYLLKTQGPPAALINTLRQRIKQLEPGRAVYGVAPLEEKLASSLGERRLQTTLLTLFGLAALLLASIGLYGVVGFYVSQKTREIGLRVALGASPQRVFGEVFLQGAAMTFSGIAAGLACGAAITRFMVSLLFGIGRWDPVSFLGAPAVLILVAALATWLPARRAMRVDPIEALRED